MTISNICCSCIFPCPWISISICRTIYITKSLHHYKIIHKITISTRFIRSSNINVGWIAPLNCSKHPSNKLTRQHCLYTILYAVLRIHLQTEMCILDHLFPPLVAEPIPYWLKSEILHLLLTLMLSQFPLNQNP